MVARVDDFSTIGRRRAGGAGDPPAVRRVMTPNWMDQNQKPDLYTRGLSVGAGSPEPPPGVGGPSLETIIEESGSTSWATVPGARPFVYQRWMQLTLAVNTTPIPLINARTEVDSIILDVYSTAAKSVFWGNMSGVTVTSGHEIQPGVPRTLIPDNTREQWELQRQLEYIAAMMARANGFPPFPSYRSPRVVFDASQIFLVASALTAITVSMFLPPELQ